MKRSVSHLSSALEGKAGIINNNINNCVILHFHVYIKTNLHDHTRHERTKFTNFYFRINCVVGMKLLTWRRNYYNSQAKKLSANFLNQIADLWPVVSSPNYPMYTFKILLVNGDNELSNTSPSFL
jgi:hypothetical protein